VDEGEGPGFELWEENVVRTNSTKEVEGEGIGENEREDDCWMGEVVPSMLLNCVDRCCGKGGNALD